MGFKDVAFGNIKDDAAVMITKAIEKTYNEFPFLKGFVKEIKTKDFNEAKERDIKNS